MADVGIVVVGEMPYAEGFGDTPDLNLSEQDVALIDRLRPTCKRLVLILISGRPMIVIDQLAKCDAFVAAWLPGTEGQGVADVLFGDYPFTGKLPYTWPRSMDQIPLSQAHSQEPLFPFGYGLGD
jgi:beta-glucosidase